MTLVPIIYTSLLIFSAILLFVVIVSYISFKAKGKTKKSIELKSQVRPINVQIKPVPSKPVVGGREAQVVRQRTSQIQYTNYNYKEQASSSRVQQEKRVANNTEPLYSSRNSNQKKLRLTRDERLSIVNAPINYSQQNQPQQRIASHRLPDLNILNYYSDKKGTEFITLSA
ncbi:MAG: hypothetical protein AB1394_10760 [Bacteroidota bacterium]